jgi:hypothetical protein
LPVDALDSLLPPELSLPLHSRAHLAQVFSLLSVLVLNLLALPALPPELPLPLHSRAHLAQALNLLSLLVQQHKY